MSSESRQSALWNAGFAILAIYLVYRFCVWVYKAYRIRTRYHGIPCLPRHPIWGNLINAGERLNPSLDRHPDYGFEEIWQQLGEPGCYFVDLAPVEDRGFLIVAEPQYVEAVVNATENFRYSLPKSDTYNALKALIGAESLITAEGSGWKGLRKRFNPGFQPKYIHSLTESLVSQVGIFVQRLRSLAETGETFKMADYAKDLTTDVITQLTVAKDFKAQSTPNGSGEKSRFGLLTASRRLSEITYSVGQGIGLHMIDPIRPVQSFVYETIFDRRLKAIVRERLSKNSSESESRSIMQLAVSNLKPSAALVQSCVDQIKSFLFAGQDTTAVLIQWMCFEMNKASHSPQHAKFLSRLQQEHEKVFGPEPFSALQKLAESSLAECEAILTNSLPYTTAFVKETLRLHPPAATVRKVPWESTSYTLSLPSGPVPIAGLRIYVNQFLLHRNPHVWGADARAFNPDRWLDEAYMSKLPAGAWRPFERGPRNCIGQELAMTEAKLVLVAIARGFIFEKVGLSGRVVVEGGAKEKEVWSAHAVTSVPVDGMVMRVKLAKT